MPSETAPPFGAAKLRCYPVGSPHNGILQDHVRVLLLFAKQTQLPVWWLRPGVQIERIKPGHPEQNGRHERPHPALGMQVPAARYKSSPRVYEGLACLDYPFHDKAVTVTTCGRICFNRQKINLSIVFAGQKADIKQTGENIWLASFMDYDLGYFDNETCRLEPLENPFGSKVLPMSPV